MSWTARDGAPAVVDMIAQTDDGFLWFGTGSGLVRFDGVQFERYAPQSGEALPPSPIRSLLALPENGLLIGWIFGGATLLRNGRAVQYGEKEGYPPGTTYQFLRDGSGYIWAATSSALVRFDGERWHRIGAEWKFPGPRAVALFLDRDGTVGAFTDNTLVTLPKGAKSFRPTGGTTTTRSPIVQAPDGTYFVSDFRGIRSIASLEKYDQLDRPWAVKGNRLDDTHIVTDRDGSLWFGHPRGLGRIAYPERRDAKVEYFTKNDGLSEEEAQVVFEDREGSIWVTTSAGVDRFRLATFLPPSPLLKVSFPAMIPDADGGLWFAGYTEKLRHVNAQGVAREIGPMFATCAYRDADGIGWFGSRRTAPHIAELLRLENGLLKRLALPAEVQPGGYVQAITMDAKHSLWASVVRKGVFRLVGKTWTRPVQLPDAGKLPAIAMTADSLGRVWLGYERNRVASWQNDSVRVYSSADGLEIGNVLTIVEKGRHIWVAGERGLGIFDAGRFRSVKTGEPNVLQGITGLVETNDGDLWIHAVSGAILIKAAEVRKAIEEPGYAMAYRLFDEEDGLSGASAKFRPLPTLLEAADGRLWFATNRGAFALDPRKIVTNSLPPRAIVTTLIADAARHVSPTAITLPALTTSLQLDYTATALAASRRVQFRYKLAGVDHDWQQARTRRQAFYTNLGPGRYQFQVVAANEDGVWDSHGATVAITIPPEWYQTSWFFYLCVLVALAVLALVYRLHVMQMLSQIQERLQERLLERERIARDLHDTLLQGFQGLVLTLEAAMRRIPAGQPAREQIAEALKQADEVLAEGRDRVRDLRDTANFQGELSSVLREAGEDLARLHPCAFTMTIHGTPRPLHTVVKEEAFLIAREAMANAFHHAEAATVELEIAYGGRQLRIQIHDDGKGIDGDVLAQGGVAGHWGISGMHERAKKLGGRLLIRSGAGSGTDVELIIPAAVAYPNRSRLARWRTILSGNSRSDT